MNDAPDLRCFSDDTFDFVLSHLTLQHMPPESAKQYIKEFLRVLAPGGLLVFQMAGEPTKVRPASIRRLRRFVRGLIPEALIELYRKARYRHLIDMHGMKQEEVVRVLEENGAEVLDVRPDTSAGGGWTSFRYCAVKGQVIRRPGDGRRPRGGYTAGRCTSVRDGGCHLRTRRASGSGRSDPD